MKTELELTELEPNRRARFVSDAGGTIWDTAFHVRPIPDSASPRTELRIEMDARPHKLLSRIVFPLLRGMIRRGMEKHIDGFKAHCEGRT